jgi:phage tail-like protein
VVLCPQPHRSSKPRDGAQTRVRDSRSRGDRLGLARAECRSAWPDEVVAIVDPLMDGDIDVAFCQAYGPLQELQVQDHVGRRVHRRRQPHHGPRAIQRGRSRRGRVTGDVQHEPVVLEGVVTSDQDFLDWARIKTSPAPEPAADDDDSRQIVVERYTGDSLHAPYTLYRCWVSEFQALPDLDANAAMVAIELCSWTMKGCMCGRVAGGSSWLRLRDTPGRPVPSTSEVHETEGDRVLFTSCPCPSPVCCFDWPSYYTSQEVDYSLQCRFLECHTGESGARCGVDHMDAHTVLPKSWTR